MIDRTSKKSFELFPELKPGDDATTEDIFVSTMLRWYTPTQMNELELYRLLLMAEGKYYSGDFGKGVEAIILGLSYGVVDDPFGKSGKQFSVPSHCPLLAGGTTNRGKYLTIENKDSITFKFVNTTKKYACDSYVNAINDGAIHLVYDLGFEGLEPEQKITDHPLKKELVDYRKNVLMEGVSTLATMYLDYGAPRDQFISRFAKAIYNY